MNDEPRICKKCKVRWAEPDEVLCKKCLDDLEEWTRAYAARRGEVWRGLDAEDEDEEDGDGK